MTDRPNDLLVKVRAFEGFPLDRASKSRDTETETHAEWLIFRLAEALEATQTRVRALEYALQEIRDRLGALQS